MKVRSESKGFFISKDNYVSLEDLNEMSTEVPSQLPKGIL